MQWDGKGETASGRCEAMDLTHDQCSHHSSRPLLSPHEISFTFFMAMTWKLSTEKKGFWGTLDRKQVRALHSSVYECVCEEGNVASVINTLSGRWCQVVFQVIYLLSSHVTSCCNFAFAFASAPATGCFTVSVWRSDITGPSFLWLFDCTTSTAPSRTHTPYKSTTNCDLIIPMCNFCSQSEILS